MPELPEVEVVRRSLVELVAGQRIIDVKVGWPKIIKSPEQHEQFQDALKGQTIRDIDRKGKFLIFLLDDYSLVSHLRMEGKYSKHKTEDPVDKHTHVIFCLSGGEELRYRDVRKFGTMHLFAKGSEWAVPPLSNLGPEPFSYEFSFDYFKGKLMKTDRFIKAVLLDQTIVTGLGNIYVDEVLFRSRIHPERKTKTLSDQEILTLKEQAALTLQESINAGGSSVNTYMNSYGQIGTYQNELKVYGRKDEECYHCGAIVQKIKVAGRGTHFCPACQVCN
ncbi:DNA-formamidopyrimidine glycosylase [Lederbergia wuyishanensis]|uniref:Formamidopyrimidine-DNA glycosylase n=1 Tax=Lederbergia wuyishanensis TaxID=1347903 RepID=A0ABU0D5B7_9BACI|nr:DNA-formamidopyrimidine glycosylase [Lederbergia wuyishanensis]MCJ8009905.1 DNA-formamidopyrimidine glycosylase [Lederbergia wuyishanensis]MDQ0343558.1 formamidopyrimidine-DNA glycosylase [Lederbergia wuyishanensis]